MRCIIIPVSIVIAVILFLGCAETAIKSTISDFEDAINDDNFSNFKETLSTESENYLNDVDIQAFLNYFTEPPLSNFLDVNFSNLDISIDGGEAEVYSDATYENGLTPVYVWFWMRREQALFAFISQDWRVYRYYDDTSGSLQFIWKKLQN